MFCISSPSWIQAGAAVALVYLTYRTLLVLRDYARDTETIAAKSVEQTENARKQVTESQRQADAAMQSLTLLKKQIQGQDAQESARVITTLHAVQSDVSIWLNTIEGSQWGAPPSLTVKLLPDDWAAVVYQAGEVSVELHSDVNSLGKILREANAQISRWLMLPIDGRGPQLKTAQPNLEAATGFLAKIIGAFEARE
jgi:hypothetical protein